MEQKIDPGSRPWVITGSGQFAPGGLTPVVAENTGSGSLKMRKQQNTGITRSGYRQNRTDETAIKRCYGGEENDEKGDLSKDDLSSLCKNDLSSLSTDDRISVDVSCVRLLKEVSSVQRGPGESRQMLDNRLTDLVEGNTAGHGDIWEADDSCPENNWEHNIFVPDHEDKNWQKHISNLLISLRDEVSTFAGESGIEEKLWNLLKHVRTKLSKQQQQRLAESVGVSGGGARLPALLAYCSLLSRGCGCDPSLNNADICQMKREENEPLESCCCSLKEKKQASFEDESREEKEEEKEEKYEDKYEEKEEEKEKGSDEMMEKDYEKMSVVDIHVDGSEKPTLDALSETTVEACSESNVPPPRDGLITCTAPEGRRVVLPALPGNRCRDDDHTAKGHTRKHITKSTGMTKRNRRKTSVGRHILGSQPGLPPNNMYTDSVVDVRSAYFRANTCMDGGGGGGNSAHTAGGGRSGQETSGRNGGDGRDFDGSNNNANPDRNDRQEAQPPGADHNDNQETNSVHSVNIPPPNYKAVRRKHSELSDVALIDLLGSLSSNSSLVIQEVPGLLLEVNHCLQITLHSLSQQSEPQSSVCSVCSVICSLLLHFSACQVTYQDCAICWQLFRLSAFHVQQCLLVGKSERESSSDICYQMMKTAKFNVDVFENMGEELWRKMKKYVTMGFQPLGVCSLYTPPVSEAPSTTTTTTGLGDVQDAVQGRNTALDSGSVTASSVGGTFLRSGSGRAFQPSLTSIPESPWRRMSKKRRSRTNRDRLSSSDSSTSLLGQKSDDRSVTEESRPKMLDLPLQVSAGELASSAEGHLSLPTPTDAASSRSSIDDVSIATSMSSASGQMDDGATGQTVEDFIYTHYMPHMDQTGNIFPSDAHGGSSGLNQDPYETQKTYGMVGVVSLPMRPTNMRVRDQLMSLEMKPTGEPGIGEVVYGTRRQIMKVAMYWARVSGGILSEKYKHQPREEGVILDSARKHLRILRTRYQKKNQWMRLVHLGNGTAGKCHLARDTTSNFNFCVKQIHIAKYQANELVTWSDLDHTNIVKLYGATRYGPKIYIFCEFVDGGSLISLINEQRSLNRRLSHWMCLRYFKQLLQVLVYLKSRNVLHEDIKADNILVKRNTTLIAVTDFGLSCHMNVDTEMKGAVPVGSQTQFSPEKATSQGHGFAADVWAAVCVLVHMLSGHPPWTQRFPGLMMLHYVIYSQSPPLDDVPDNIQDGVKSLISAGFTVDPHLRPMAVQLLQHHAFNILDQGAPDSYYSMLLGSGQALPINTLVPTAAGAQEMEEILISIQVSSSVSTTDRTGPSSEEGKSSSASGGIQTASTAGAADQAPSSLVVQSERSSVVSTSGVDSWANVPVRPGTAGSLTSVTSASGSISSTHRSQVATSRKVKVLDMTDFQPEESEDFYDVASVNSGSDDDDDVQAAVDDENDCYQQYLHDDTPDLNLSMIEGHLEVYRPPQQSIHSEAGINNLPHFSILLDSFSIGYYEGIVLEANTPDEEAVHGFDHSDSTQKHPPAQDAGNAGLGSQRGSHGQRGSLGQVSRDAEQTTANRIPGQDIPGGDQSLSEEPVTSYYPSPDMYGEHISSGDLFGGPGDDEPSYRPSDFSTQPVDRPGGRTEMTSETGAAQRDVLATTVSQPKSQPSAISVTSASIFGPGAADFGIESRRAKDCPMESASIDVEESDVSCTKVKKETSSRSDGKGWESKNPGLTIDLNKKVKSNLKRFQSQPGEGNRKVVKAMAHPGTCPESLDKCGVWTGGQEGSSDLGSSLPHAASADALVGSHRSHDTSGTSGVFNLDDRGRLTSAESSPGTQRSKSQYDHQEKEFDALEKLSQSDISAHDHSDLLQELTDDANDQGISVFTSAANADYQSLLASVQKQLPDRQEECPNLHLLTESGEHLADILLCEDWTQVIDLIRSQVSEKMSVEHFVLCNQSGDNIDYYAPISKCDLVVYVHPVTLESANTTACWCAVHEYQCRLII